MARDAYQSDDLLLELHISRRDALRLGAIIALLSRQTGAAASALKLQALAEQFEQAATDARHYIVALDVPADDELIPSKPEPRDPTAWTATIRHKLAGEPIRRFTCRQAWEAHQRITHKVGQPVYGLSEWLIYSQAGQSASFDLGTFVVDIRAHRP